MKILSYLFVIFASVLHFSCSSPSEDDPLLKTIMKNWMSNLGHSDYTETKKDQTVKFETNDKRFVLEGLLKQVEDYKVLTLYANDIETQRYLTAIFAKEGGVWQSVFNDEIVAGILDTIIDLNSDKVPEIILQQYERNKVGFESQLVVYTKKEAQKYLPIGGIGTNYFRSVNKKASSTVELLQVDDYTKLFVKTEEFDSINKNQKQESSFYLVTTLGELNQEFANQLILCSEPLLFKVSQDNFWGIYSRVGKVISSEPLNFMDGFADMLTSSSKTKHLLPAEYTEILTSSEGFIPVKNKDGLWGFVNLKGELVVDCKYIAVSKFERGKAVVWIPGEKDWRKAYKYIDEKGKELGLFFDKIGGKDCIDIRLTLSGESGEKFSEHHLINCPNGIISVKYQGWEWSSGETFYPGESIEQLIPQLSKTNNEYTTIYKKFAGNTTEYSDGDYTISIIVEKDNDGNITSVNFSRNSDYEGGNRTFEQQENGVLLKESHGQ